MKTLDGLNIIITRPEAQAIGWQQQLHALGATTRLLPVMNIVPLIDDVHLQAIHDIQSRLHQFQKIVFISQNAVAFARQQLGVLPQPAQLFAIGSATAKALNDWVGETVSFAREAMNSEELLQSPDLQNIAGQTVLLCRGVGGRKTLTDTLLARGARVEICELYQRCSNPQSSNRLSQALSMNAGPGQRVVSAHSGESVELLTQMLAAKVSTLDNEAIKSLPLLVPGDRVADIAKNCGFKQTITALNASNTAMTQTLIDWWRQQGLSTGPSIGQ